MNALGQETYLMELFSKEFCIDLIRELDQVEEARWFHRAKINSIPTKGSNLADYYFLGNHQMSKEMSERLFEAAPLINGLKPTEVCINKYLPGGYMSEHIDSSMMPLYMHNLVLQLSDCGDGIEIEGEFYRDNPGHAIIMPAVSKPHGVPPVKHKRYVMICLYE